MMVNVAGSAKTKITNIVSDMDVQPNAVDVRLKEVFKIDENDTFIIDNDSKQHRNLIRIEDDADGWFTLENGAYSIVLENEIAVADDECGFVITRSTFVRNGCFLETGLYDSGYVGKMIQCLHVTCGTVKIKRGTRIGQYLCFKSESLHSYDGDYGTNKEHDKKYE